MGIKNKRNREATSQKKKKNSDKKQVSADNNNINNDNNWYEVKLEHDGLKADTL